MTVDQRLSALVTTRQKAQCCTFNLKLFLSHLCFRSVLSTIRLITKSNIHRIGKGFSKFNANVGTWDVGSRINKR
jgi:hypothetical protein